MCKNDTVVVVHVSRMGFSHILRFINDPHWPLKTQRWSVNHPRWWHGSDWWFESKTCDIYRIFFHKNPRFLAHAMKIFFLALPCNIGANGLFLSFQRNEIRQIWHIRIIFGGIGQIGLFCRVLGVEGFGLISRNPVFWGCFANPFSIILFASMLSFLAIFVSGRSMENIEIWRFRFRPFFDSTGTGFKKLGTTILFWSFQGFYNW